MLVLAAALPHYLFLPLSLNSLDREGVRLLSPRDSKITSKTSLQVPLNRAGDVIELMEELDEDLISF